METLETLQRRIAISTDLQSIVRTMKTLSAVTVRRSDQAIRAVRAYDETVDLGIQVFLRDPALAEATIAASEAALSAGPAGLIVLGSDHGLCGRFNNHAVAQALAEIATLGPGTAIAAVGARAADLLDAAGHPASAVFATPGSAAGLRAATSALLGLIDRWQGTDGIGRVRIVHTVQTAETPVRPVALGLLPVSPAYLRHQRARPWPSRRLPGYSAAPDLMLGRLVREHVFVRIFRALAEAQASEHAARLIAMQSAERGIRDRLEAMQADHRRRRQEAITSEVLDIVAGAAAYERA